MLTRTRIHIAAVAAATLGACSSLPLAGPAQTSMPAIQPAIQDAEKALTIAHLAYQGIGLSLKSAAESGVLHGADAATAKALYDKAGALLDAADQADALANAQGVFDAVTQASALIAQVDALIKK